MRLSKFKLLSTLAILNLVSASLFSQSQSTQNGGSWWQFRGSNGAGIASDSPPLPSKLDDIQALSWSVPIPLGHSSPIAIEDRIVLTGYEDGELLVMSFAEATGETVWKKKIKVPTLEKTHPLHGPASSTPASDGERIFVTFGSFGILCFDLDGNELWKVERPIKKNMFGSAASPIVHRQRLIAYSGNEEESVLEAFDTISGRLLWERRRQGAASSWSTPVIRELDGISEILFYEPYHLRAVDLSGNDRWSVPRLADEPITVPQLQGETVFATSYNLRTNSEVASVPTFAQLLDECDTNKDRLIDYNEAKRNKSILSRPDADGQGDHPLTMFLRLLDENKDKLISEAEWSRIHLWMDPWEHTNGVVAIRPGSNDVPPELLWQQPKGVPECPSPILIDGHLLMVRNGGVVTAINSKTGQIEFQDRLPSGGPYYASPVLADGKLILASARGEITMLSATPWPPKPLCRHEIGESVHATPAISKTGLIIRSEKHLWKFAR